jgi:hypothetical protein
MSTKDIHLIFFKVKDMQRIPEITLLTENMTLVKFHMELEEKDNAAKKRQSQGFPC